VLRKAILRLAQSHPRLVRWLGDRLDLQVPALGASLLTHLALLAALAMVGYAAHTEAAREFRTEVVSTSLADFAKLDTTALAETDRPTTMTPVQGSTGPKLSPMRVEAPPSIAVATQADAAKGAAGPELSRGSVTLAGGIALPTVTSLGQSVAIRGTGSEQVGNVEGAVDRVAVEILRQMERGRTLVVWAFDASGSLVAERQRLGKYIDGVYAHIARMDPEHRVEAGALLTAVVGFGKERKILTAEPTVDRQTIASAIAAVPLDTSGVETTFQTVVDIARKWGTFKRDGEPYRLMIVVVTDEVGDDEERLDDAISAARAVKAPVYVLGSAALFGRVEGYQNYTDPKTGHTYYNLPVRQGPESLLPEMIRLPFWYDGPQYEFLDAGFGPYALSRLAGATGGIYFVTRMGSTRVTFDPAGMREYRPDWVSKPQYVAAVNKHPVREAVLRAAMITQQQLPGQPSLRFPAVDDGPDFKEAMKRNQEVVARAEYTVNMALEPITAVAKKRDHETSRRWQAHYDLIRGRLLAMKLRCYEYNAACARMQKDPLKFTSPKSNAWRLAPTDQLSSGGTKAEAVAAEAKALLKRVVTDHPGTPWALLAQRELKDPFGFKWVETTAPPNAKRNNNGNAKNQRPKRPEPPKPAEVPKL
jgi:hypothetical protein